VENLTKDSESANVLHLPVRKPPVALKVKSMTIAVSLKCSVGVVVAADRLFTHAEDSTSLGAFGSYDRKVFRSEGNHHAALVTGAGNKNALYSLQGSLLVRLRVEDTSDARLLPLSVKEDLEEELAVLSGKLGVIPDLSTLVAISEEPFGVQVLRSDGLVVRLAGDTEVVGIGENSLTQFLLDTLYRPTMDEKQGAALAVLIIQLAKKYCPQYCGGMTDVSYFYGVAPYHYDLRDDEVDALERMLPRENQRSLSDIIEQASRLIS